MDRIADYELVRSLGEGNHGEFFVAHPPARLGLEVEFVAVKVLTAVRTEDAFRRATRELRAFAAVSSPYLVRLFDAGQDGAQFFYSMEYFPLGSLATPARPLERFEALRAISTAASAVHALHEAGIVHRGVKPANILLADDGGRLSDLGLAETLSPGQTVTGLGPIGSIEYLDPAILRGERGSRASDIWSLGVTLHRALTGVGLYGEIPERDPIVAVRRVLTAEPAISSELTGTLADLVKRCVDPDPAARPRTALEFAEAVDADSTHV
jgi:serine/threonine protein kinase